MFLLITSPSPGALPVPSGAAAPGSGAPVPPSSACAPHGRSPTLPPVPVPHLRGSGPPPAASWPTHLSAPGGPPPVAAQLLRHPGRTGGRAAAGLLCRTPAVSPARSYGWS